MHTSGRTAAMTPFSTRCAPAVAILGAAVPLLTLAAPARGAPPLHRIAFPDSPLISTATFSPDGRVLYVQTFPELINFWEVLVFLWPELLGALSALVALVALPLILRVLRHPQRRGEPHCRRCNYNLSGVPSTPTGPEAPRTCSECGADLSRTPPRTGRSTRRRLAPILVPALAVVLAYTALWAVRLPRQGRASTWRLWPSARLTAFAEERKVPWLTSMIARRERILAVDPATGSVVRTVSRRSTPTDFPLRVTPDGRWFLLSAGPNALERVSTRDGSPGGRVAIPGRDSHRRFGGRDIAGFTPDGGSAYVVHLDRLTTTTRVVRWDLATDEVTPVFETEAYSDPKSRGGADARRVLLVPGEPPMFAVAPSFSEAYHRDRYAIWLHDAATGGVVREIDVAENPCTSFPVVTPDGGRLLIANRLDGIQGFDLRTGESLGTVKPDYRLDTALDDLLLSADGSLLLFPVHPDGILVRGMARRRWIGRLSAGDLLAPTLSISPDGRWLAVVGFKRAGPIGGKYLHELLIHDLSTLPTAGTPPQP